MSSCKGLFIIIFVAGLQQHVQFGINSTFNVNTFWMLNFCCELFELEPLQQKRKTLTKSPNRHPFIRRTGERL